VRPHSATKERIPATTGGAGRRIPAIAAIRRRPAWRFVAVTVLAGLWGWMGRASAEDASPAVPERSAIRARVLTAPPTIDGEIRPEEWPEDPASTLRIDRAEQVLAARRERWKGPLDAHLVARVGIDAEALYVAFSVTDDVALHTGDPWHGGDSIELFLNTDLADDREGEDGPATETGYSDDDWQLFLMPGNPHLRWGVAYHGDGVRYDDGGLVGVRMATRPRGGGSYDLEVKIPLANFPGLAGTAARRIGFDVALNDVDRFVPAATAAGLPQPDPATYLSSRGLGDLYRIPSRFLTLEIPERTAPPRPVAADEDGSATLWLTGLLALVLVIALVGPLSRHLARAGPRPKAAMLALDVLLAGFLALSSSCEDRRAREVAQTRLDAAVNEAQVVAAEAADLGALDAADAAARSRTLGRLLAGESVPCLPPVAAHAFVRLAPWPGEPEFTGSSESRIALTEGADAEWPLTAPLDAVGFRVRLAPVRTAGHQGGGERALLATLVAVDADGRSVEAAVETNLADGAGERVVRVSLGAQAAVRLRWRHAPGAPPAVLVAMSVVRPDGTEAPLPLPTWTDDRIPILARPGARPGGAGTFLGTVIVPRGERQFALPALAGADRLWLVVAVERGFPLTRHGQEVAEVRVQYAVGEPSVHRLVNGDDVDEERLNQAIRHPADMRSRVAYRWTDDAGTPRHHDLVSVPLDFGRRPTSVRVKNLSASVPEQGTGSLLVAAATLARHVAGVAGGRLAVAPDAENGGDRAFLRDARPFAEVLAVPRGDAVRTLTSVGRADRKATVTFATPLPGSVAERARRTEVALLTCLGIAAFLLVLLVVDFVEGFRRLAPRLVIGVLAAALLPVAVTVVLADRRNTDRLEAEREARVRGWLAAARGAILGSERQEAQVGAQGDT